MVVLGASFDPIEENRDFATDQGFTFSLLSDTDRSVGTAYEVARGPSDKFAAFARRYSYLIDPDGVIAKSYDVTDVALHADQVLTDVEAAQAARGSDRGGS